MNNETTALILRGMISRVSAGFQWAMSHAIHNHKADLNTAQLLMANILYNLKNDDVATFTSILCIAEIFADLESSYIAIWLRDEFCFGRNDIEKSLCVTARLVANEVLCVTSPIVRAIIGLQNKYHLDGYFYQYLKSWSFSKNHYLKGNITVTQIQVQAMSSTSVEPVAATSKVQYPALPSTSSTTATSTSREQSPAMPSTSSETKNQLEAMPSTSSEPVASISRVQPQIMASTSLETVASTSRAETQTTAEHRDWNKQLWDGINARDFYAVQKALSHSADPNSCISGNWTPLHSAVRDGHLAIVGLLLSSGADPHRKSYPERFTPLHLAAMWSKIDCARLLLDYGANVNAKDRRNMTPFDYAKYKKNQVLAAMIKTNKGYYRYGV